MSQSQISTITINPPLWVKKIWSLASLWPLLLGQVFNRSVNSSFIVLEALKDADEMDEMVRFYDFYIL